jgi:hypothetical protein
MKDSALYAIPPRQPESAVERIARQTGLCAEMADLSAQLARHTAARILATKPEELPPPAAEPQDNRTAEPQDNRTAEPQANIAAEPQADVQAEPQADITPEPPPAPTAEPRVIPAPTAARPRAAATYFRVPPVKPVDDVLNFTRLVATMCACLSLEDRIANGTAGRASAAASTAPSTGAHEDPRREKLLEGFRIVTKNCSNRAELMRQTTARADQKLAEEPTEIVPHLLEDICNELDITIDLSQLPDEFLAPIPPEAERIRDIQELIRLCATPPPKPKK